MSIQLIKSVLSRGYVAHRICGSVPATFTIVAKRSLVSDASHHPTDATTSTTTTSPTRSDEPISLAKNPFEREKQKCILCRMNIQPDYKNVRLLSQFQSPYTGRIYGRHITGLCRFQQNLVEKEIMKSHRTGHMGSYHKAVEFLHDPKLFDAERPIRPHNY